MVYSSGSPALHHACSLIKITLWIETTHLNPEASQAGNLIFTAQYGGQA
jgi:hypothetical protein